ncbi:hypothetical protein V8J82_02720 [Gymnodinialimonas sp. 2305UL16-5]|uniref:hypothetical protein n=1 Tax=Gymnodinialimonas mytili TaxID=3126503 RepID=UPI0030B01555
MASTASAPCDALAFDDIIDGYFPLRVSLADMMVRRGLRQAQLTLSHAPIMDVPGLGWQEPVPLNIRSGRAGMIDWMVLRVAVRGSDLAMSGQACWRWFDGGDPGPAFDPMTRLAEPAYLLGVAEHKDPPCFENGISYVDNSGR